MRNLRVALGLCVLLGACIFGVAGAAAEDEEPNPKPPLYEGAWQFPIIHGPEDPESYSWTVQLYPGQELVQAGEHRVEVVWTEGGEPIVMWVIDATRAHDSDGAEVPTTIEVTESDVITVTVHHLAGDPTAGGAPFDYPISAGPGFEVGFSTVIVRMPEVEKQPAPTCVVPRLTGRSLAASRDKLAVADCKLGAVRGKRGKGVKVVKQFRAPGTVLGAGAKVAIKLG